VAPTKQPARLAAIDAVRGLVMIVMALDHVRDFVHRAAMQFSPTDLTQTTPAIFFTRWITHFCAPVFMLTAGLGAFFWWHGKRTRKQLSVFLLTRGLWLILLELTVMRVAYYFSFSAELPVLLLVLWALGLSMVALAALVWLPARVLAVLSVAMIALHNLLDPVNAAQFGRAAGIWNLLHQVGAFRVGPAPVLAGYSLVPWVAVMAAGFCLGRVFLLEPAARQRTLTRLGMAATAAFVLLRAVNIYGDPVRWAPQKSAIFTQLSFLNCTKYPPSLDFLLMTLGPALMAMAWFDRMRFGAANPLIVFGRVPLFYFVVHFYGAHAIADVLALFRYGSGALRFLFHPMPTAGGASELFPPDFGYDLWVVYAAWAFLVAAMHLMCRRYARLKSQRREWWWSYL